MTYINIRDCDEKMLEFFTNSLQNTLLFSVFFFLFFLYYAMKKSHNRDETLAIIIKQHWFITIKNVYILNFKYIVCILCLYYVRARFGYTGMLVHP